MIKLLFCPAKYEGSIGEVTNARLFYKQLPPDKYECYFLVNNESKKYINHLGVQTLNFNEIINKKFDIIIISDYYPFVRSIIEKTCNEKEKKVYEYLFSLNIPVFVIDVLGLYGNLIIDNLKHQCVASKLCLKPYNIKCNPVSCNPVNFHILYPCPPHTPCLPKAQNCHFVPLEHFPAESLEKNNVKTIFMAISNWEYELMKKHGKGIYPLILEKLLIHCLLKLDKKINLIIVTPSHLYFDYSIENINVKHIVFAEEYVEVSLKIPRHGFKVISFGQPSVYTERPESAYKDPKRFNFESIFSWSCFG